MGPTSKGNEIGARRPLCSMLYGERKKEENMMD
jgi:hypothetical protein